MWLSDRRGFLLGIGAVSLTTACGFTPVYGDRGNGRALRGAIRADDPVSRSDFDFVAAFEDLLGRPNAPRYALSYTIAQREVGGGAVQNFGYTRYQIFGTLDYSVSDIATGTERARGRIEGDTAYSTTSTQFASLTAKEDAQLRLMRMLADGLVTRLYTEPGLTTGDSAA